MNRGFLRRSRLDEIFDQATCNRFVWVIAGVGYGKTQAVRHYIERQPGVVSRWLPLTEGDNSGSHYWEKFVHVVAFDNPNLALRLRELGFPDTLFRFKQYAEILQNEEHSCCKVFLVLDDFQLIHSREMLVFMERCAHLQIPGSCVIIISQTEPEINAVSLFSVGKAGRITEDELCFTEDEIAVFFRQNDIAFSSKDLPDFFDATKGWAQAVKLLSLVLEKNPNHPDYAVDVMKQNVFKLLEMQAWSNFSDAARNMLIKASLIDNLPSAALSEILGADGLLQTMPELTSFVWFDSFTSAYRTLPLYREFIQSKQENLSSEDAQEVYRRAAQWCSARGYYMDTVYYFAKSRQFGRMVEALLSHPLKLPVDTCEYFLSVLEDLDLGRESQDDLNVLLLESLFVPVFLAGAGNYEEAQKRSYDLIAQWERSASPYSSLLSGIAYANLAYVDLYTCTVSHRYGAARYLKKAAGYLKQAPLPLPLPPTARSGPGAVADIRSYACVIGTEATLPEFDQFLAVAQKAVPYAAGFFYGRYYGYDDLVACEIAFFKNQIDTARIAAHSAIIKAREKKQYNIEALAEFYLLCIAVQESNYPLIKELLAQLRAHLDNPDFWDRQLIYDLCIGFFYAQIGLPEMVPAWFVVEGNEIATEALLPVGELIVSVKYQIASKKYDQALTVLCASTPRSPQERFLLGELTFSLLMAVSKSKMGDTAGATEDFKKAWRLSFDGVFEMPFIELGRDLHALVSAVSKQAGGEIASQRLKVIDRKASAYAKKADIIRDLVKKERNIENKVQLSARELDVLSDLYQGLSREEIAASRYLSINTVKKVAQSLYLKLDASNMADAIRIAIEQKLIE